MPRAKVWTIRAQNAERRTQNAECAHGAPENAPSTQLLFAVGSFAYM